MNTRLVWKLMNTEKALRNLSEFAMVENLDDEAPAHEFLTALEKRADEIADELSDLTEAARKLKEA